MSTTADLVLNDPDVRAELDALRLLVEATDGNVITFVLYRNVAEREAAVQYLKEHLAIPVVECALSKRRTDPLAVIEEVREPRACVQVYDLETALPEATKYLNLRREAYAALPHALVLWVGEHGLREVARDAPDFWSWRSGVFDARTEQPDVAQAITQQAFQSDIRFTDRGDLERRASLYKGLIQAYEANDEADAAGIAHLRLKLAGILYLLRAFEQARQQAEAVRVFAEASDDAILAAITYHQLGRIAEEQRDFATAETWYKKSLAIKERQGNEHGAAITYGQLGVLAALQENYVDSGQWFIRSVKVFLQANDSHRAQQLVNNFMIAVSRASRADQATLRQMWAEAGLPPLPEDEDA